VTVPEVRRLLRLLTVPVEQQGFHLHWSHWRRAHQAVARRSHSAARARAQPAPCRAAPSALPPCPPARPPWTELNAAGWARVQPLLPPPAARGRPPRDARRVLAGVVWIVRTQAAWRQLPPEFGPWRTLYGHYRLWCATGLWPRLLQALQETERSQPEVSLSY
jgi:Putative transposase of IS4/5 family (DUF4096)